ncbi:MAG: 2Fe-2S iron-sulfur cluster-binding protein [Candidatus Heimdallarchaeota archaeon]
MPTITILKDGTKKTIEAAPSERLVLAIERAGIDIGHRCGGFARCTTCRVEIHSGEPEKMTKAELTRLEDRGLKGHFRLSCQILCEQNMEVSPKYFVSEKGWDGPGKTPERNITPEAEWVSKS